MDVIAINVEFFVRYDAKLIQSVVKCAVYSFSNLKNYYEKKYILRFASHL